MGGSLSLSPMRPSTMANSNAGYFRWSRKARRAFGCQFQRMVETAWVMVRSFGSVSSSKSSVSTKATGEPSMESFKRGNGSILRKETGLNASSGSSYSSSSSSSSL